jgi:inner membrane protease subunit 1
MFYEMMEFVVYCGVLERGSAEDLFIRSFACFQDFCNKKSAALLPLAESILSLSSCIRVLDHIEVQYVSRKSSRFFSVVSFLNCATALFEGISPVTTTMMSLVSLRRVLDSHSCIIHHGLFLPGTCSKTWRFFAASSGKRKRPHWARHSRPKQQQKQEEPAVATLNHSQHKSGNSELSYGVRFLHLILPKRFGRNYTYEEGMSLAYRLPAFLVLALLLTWDETSPYTLIRIQGPSMLPTMAADGSDTWLRATWCWWKRFAEVPYQRGDLTGFCHPDQPFRISCKRIVGLPGDRVNRYGQYVHLYVEQDPENWGMMWPDESDKVHSWINKQWDTTPPLEDRIQESQRTIIVPEGHVWLEADCPGLGIDSRHFGPIPIDWLKGKVVSRMWPLGPRVKGVSINDRRPHPIPLDEETLKQYNVHLIADPTSTTEEKPIDEKK